MRLLLPRKLRPMVGHVPEFLSPVRQEIVLTTCTVCDNRYNTPPFCIANGEIPQLNIWDDHDIIDGFGSYVDHFMKSDVFRGIGGTAHKCTAPPFLSSL